jgi:hypothetical protein
MPAHAVCHEVMEFIRASEDLLSPDILAAHFTTNESDIVGYYLMAMSGEWNPVPLRKYRLGFGSGERSEVANFGRAVQSLIAVAILSSCALTEREHVLIAYFVTRLQEELIFPID